MLISLRSLSGKSSFKRKKENFTNIHMFLNAILNTKEKNISWSTSKCYLLSKPLRVKFALLNKKQKNDHAEASRGWIFGLNELISLVFFSSSGAAEVFDVLRVSLDLKTISFLEFALSNPHYYLIHLNVMPRHANQPANQPYRIVASKYGINYWACLGYVPFPYPLLLITCILFHSE